MNHPYCRYCGELIEWVLGAHEWRDADGDAICPDSPRKDSAHTPTVVNMSDCVKLQAGVY